jgi:hypothetical protein
MAQRFADQRLPSLPPLHGEAQDARLELALAADIVVMALIAIRPAMKLRLPREVNAVPGADTSAES